MVLSGNLINLREGITKKISNLNTLVLQHKIICLYGLYYNNIYQYNILKINNMLIIHPKYILLTNIYTYKINNFEQY